MGSCNERRLNGRLRAAVVGYQSSVRWASSRQFVPGRRVVATGPEGKGRPHCGPYRSGGNAAGSQGPRRGRARFKGHDRRHPEHCVSLGRPAAAGHDPAQGAAIAATADDEASQSMDCWAPVGSARLLSGMANAVDRTVLTSMTMVSGWSDEYRANQRSVTR